VLAATAPLFLLLFAAAYFLMAQDDPGKSTAETLTRTDSVYFTVTIFATVGFGDISASSEAARVLVTFQMILDLIVLGLGIAFSSEQSMSAARKSATDHKHQQPTRELQGLAVARHIPVLAAVLHAKCCRPRLSRRQQQFGSGNQIVINSFVQFSREYEILIRLSKFKECSAAIAAPATPTGGHPFPGIGTHSL
jgi:hypothetical protein